ncbi:MAG TPA: hypothetical protein VM939_03880 [Gemmatimonadaceae bacterium]|nr:hypothetical protein [Gemmatimonadaceae bacterium]
MERAFVSERHVVAVSWNRIFHVAIFGALLAVPRDVSAQVVTPKTVPVLQDGQFDMYPSSQAGMAGATIAIDDSLLDPFVNPAKAARIRGGRIFTSPYFHSVSGSRGGGRTLPLGGSGSWGAWSAAGLFTFQQLDRAGPTWNLSTSERSAFNQYLSGILARRISSATSIGFGAHVASLSAIDGVDLLYGGSDKIDQSGGLADFRLGLTKETGIDRNFEVMLVHSRTRMRHDVRFRTFAWNPVTRQQVVTERNERNDDRTNIWGLHSEFSRPVGTEGWRLGWLGTASRLSHPKIPNYVIQNIPRDPGTTYGFNGGMGISRSGNGTTFAADLIYEPMFADTWADAAKDTLTVDGVMLPAGARTVENTFNFSNVKMRLGVGHELNRDPGETMFGFQAGLGLYAINYRLQQTNNVLKTFRTQREDWIEWSPTLGLRMRARDLDIMYNFSMTCGPGGCDSGFGWGRTVVDSQTPGGGGIIAAPSSELFIDSGALTIHKLTVSLPIR